MPHVFSVRHDTATRTSDTLETNKHIADLSNILAQQQRRLREVESLVQRERAPVTNVAATRGGFANNMQRNSYLAQNMQRTQPPQGREFPRGQQRQGAYPRGNARPQMRGQSSSARGNARFPTPVYPNRLDFCFYHRTFGRDARNHDLPCAWNFPPKK